MGKLVSVTALKYGGKPHCSQLLAPLYEAPGLRVLYGKPNDPFHHHTRGKTFIFPEAGVYCFFSNRPYVPVLIATKGSGVRLYCHAAMPARLYPGAVSYVDLEIDVLRKPGGDLYAVDWDEYVEMRTKSHYPANVMHLAESAEQAIKRDIAHRIFPFDKLLSIFNERCEDYTSLKAYFTDIVI